MNVHPYLAIFPLMTTEELISLAEDIKANGLQLPVLIDDQDRIVDGRNRLAACKMAGIAPVYEPVSGDDQKLLARIVSLNLARRHLNESQRGMIAAQLANLENGQRKDRPVSSRADLPTLNEVEPVSLTDAADSLQVSRRLAVSCKKVLREGVPELVQAVQAGAIRATPAERIASLPKKEQPQAIQNHVNRVSAPVLEQEKPKPLPPEEPEVKRSPLQELVSRRLEKENPIQVAHDAIGLLKTISREHPLHREAWIIVRNFINCNLEKSKS